MYIKSAIAIGFLIGLFLVGSAGISLSKDSPVVVNLMLDADINHTPNSDQIAAARDGLISLTNEIDPNLINATIFVSEDIANAYRLGITEQGTRPTHELALHGNATDREALRLVRCRPGGFIDQGKECTLSLLRMWREACGYQGLQAPGIRSK